MKIPRIMIAAGSSGSGKTTITCGLLKALKNRGLKTVSFKCGPDYIDPMFHKTILDTPSKNLDTFFTDTATVCQLMSETEYGSDISVIEGVMGYYDGAGIKTHTASSYELANVTGTPVIFIVNARGMGISIIPYIKGFLEYKKNSGIKGIILNETSEMVYNTLKPVIEKEFNITVAGFLPEMPGCHFESRHLGLVTPDGITDIKEKIENISIKIEQCIDIDKIISIAGTAPYIEIQPFQITPVCSYGKIRIGVAMDEAFCFYYEDNLKLLEKLGAELIYFSPLHDNMLPADINGCILGGGYPELYLDGLSNNTSMLKSINHAFTTLQMPYIAECGGFLYLHENMEDTNHHNYKLAGVIQADALYKKHLQHFGYINLSPADNTTGKKREIKAHEFHYYDSTDNGSCFIAQKPFRDTSWNCIHQNGQGFAGFPHLYLYSNPGYARRFVQKCLDYSLLRKDS